MASTRPLSLRVRSFIRSLSLTFSLSSDYGAPPVYSSDPPTAPQPGYPPVGGYEAPPAYSAAPHNSLVSSSSQPQVQQYSSQYMAQTYGAFPPPAQAGASTPEVEDSGDRSYSSIMTFIVLRWFFMA